MKKLFVHIFVIATLFLFSACKNTLLIETKSVYEITIKATEVYNNHVGSEWKKTYTCEGETITSGEWFSVPTDTTKTITIDATITEIDKWSDTGCSSVSVILKDGFETETVIEITEDNGRFKGNKAEWKITYKVELIR